MLLLRTLHILFHHTLSPPSSVLTVLLSVYCCFSRTYLNGMATVMIFSSFCRPIVFFFLFLLFASLYKSVCLYNSEARKYEMLSLFILYFPDPQNPLKKKREKRKVKRGREKEKKKRNTSPSPLPYFIISPHHPSLLSVFCLPDVAF